MKETLLVGDYLFVSKLSYGYSRYSFPCGLIPFKGRIFARRAQARRRRRLQAAARQLHRLHQARDRPAGRRDHRARRRALHQRPGSAAQVRNGDFVTPEDAGPPADPGATRRRCPTASSTTVLDSEPQRTVRQRRPLQGAARPLLHDGRQPRQLHRQPRVAGWRRLRAVREPGRARRDHLLLGRRRRARRLPAGTSPWTWPFDIRWSRFFRLVR